MSAVGSPHEDKSDVDREIRLEKMKRELEDLSGESMISGSFGDLSPEMEEIFLERVCEFEKAKLDTNFNRLIQRGVEMGPPAELDDSNLHAKLQEVLQTLAEMRCFIHGSGLMGCARKRRTWRSWAVPGILVPSAVAPRKTSPST